MVAFVAAADDGADSVAVVPVAGAQNAVVFAAAAVSAVFVVPVELLVEIVADGAVLTRLHVVASVVHNVVCTMPVNLLDLLGIVHGSAPDSDSKQVVSSALLCTLKLCVSLW